MEKRILKQLLEAKNNISYNIVNHFINKIPFWPLRKLLYKVFGLKIGKGSYILRNVCIVAPKKISIGKNTYINEHCFLDGRSGIEIGDNVTIAVFSKIITGGHEIDDETFAYKGSNVIIGDHVAIFADTLILEGAIIGNGCVIAARSLVRHGTYEDNCIYAGNPAKIVRKRNCKLMYTQDQWKPIFR